MNKLLSILFMTGVACSLYAQQTENIVIVTLDGFRWQELYSGADSLLIDDSGYVENPEELVEEFWDNDPLKRREMLMPFFWNTIAKEGQLYGNRHYGNKVNCSNNMWFSYPGYNEILTGKSDDERIRSNDKIPNPNKTILEILNNRKGFKGKVAAFGSWDVFPFIINEERSNLPVNAGFDKATDATTDREQFLNRLQDEIRGPWGGVRLDVFTHHFALEYIKNNHPKVVYIAYGETDDFAHDGEYDQYLKSAHQTDAYIKELWEYLQSQEQYRDKTTLLITTDHGRGTHPKDTWKHHGTRIPNAGEIWFAAIGPETPASGELKLDAQYYQNQVAATAMTLLGESFDQDGTGKPIAEAIKK